MLDLYMKKLVTGYKDICVKVLNSTLNQNLNLTGQGMGFLTI